MLNSISVYVLDYRRARIGNGAIKKCADVWTRRADRGLRRRPGDELGRPRADQINPRRAR